MKIFYLITLSLFFLLFLSIFPAQGQEPISPDSNGGGLALEEDCRIERIGGQLAQRVRCFLVVPDLFIRYFIVSSILGGILVVAGSLVEQRLGQPKKYKKLALVVLFLLPFFILLLFG